MPQRGDLKKILILGSGPIVIGQACEFDYSGSQACKVLKEEGYRVILVNSNPATIMTDPEFADATYIEPLTTETVEKIISQFKNENFSSIIGLGGGSSLDVAKFVAFKMRKKKIMIPTTFGSGSEVTRISVFNVDRKKTSFHNDKILILHHYMNHLIEQSLKVFLFYH